MKFWKVLVVFLKVDEENVDAWWYWVKLEGDDDSEWWIGMMWKDEMREYRMNEVLPTLYCPINITWGLARVQKWKENKFFREKINHIVTKRQFLVRISHSNIIHKTKIPKMCHQIKTTTRIYHCCSYIWKYSMQFEDILQHRWALYTVLKKA